MDQCKALRAALAICVPHANNNNSKPPPPPRKLTSKELGQLESRISADDAVGLHSTLVYLGADPRIKAGPLDATFIHFAAQECALSCITSLLGVGISPNVRDGKGETPLHWVTFSCEGPCE